MNKLKVLLFILLSAPAFLKGEDSVTMSRESLPVERREIFKGLCDASGVVPVSEKYFVVAEDEQNILRMYDSSRPGSGPVKQKNLTRYFGLDKGFRRHTEIDLEAAARLNNRIYFIASHGRSGSGKLRPNRYSFFATEKTAEGIAHPPQKKPYRLLLDYLLRDSRLTEGDPYLFKASTQLSAGVYPKLAPKEKGLNIEGLSSGPGNSLLIGFRNPIPDDKAILLPFLNPADVIDRNYKPRFSRPHLFDFNGRGIRAITRHTGGGGYAAGWFVIAGPHDSSADFALYHVEINDIDDPSTSSSRLVGLLPEEMNAEAVYIVQGSNPLTLRIFNDDGNHIIDGRACKQWHLTGNTAKPRFRSYLIGLP